ncbi:MAG: hypothetical protein AAF125_06390, partial [Chloroflexota bacterium]
YLALTAKLGGDLTSLAPLNPGVDYLYAPGFGVTVAYLSERLSLPLHSVQFGLGAALALWVVMCAYDLGVLVGGRGLARAYTLAAMLGLGLFTAYMDSHYTSVFGLGMGLSFLCWLHLLMVPRDDVTDPWYDIAQSYTMLLIAAALSLAALVLIHPDTTIIIGMGYVVWLLTAPFGTPKADARGWLSAMFFVAPLAVLFLLPWFVSVYHLLGADIVSPFERDITYWRVALGVPPQILYQGILILPLALYGAWVGLRRRDQTTLLGLGWLLLVLDFAAFGLIEGALPHFLASIVSRYDYPFSIAWHGPIIPFIMLGGTGLWALWEAFYDRATVYDPTADPEQEQSAPRLIGYSVLIIILSVVLLAGTAHRDVLAFSKARGVNFFGAFSSFADVQAMLWLRTHTPQDALILNFPGPQEGDWVPVISERESVYYRPQPFFQHVDGTPPLGETERQIALRAFWEDPANNDNGLLLLRYGVDYIIVPQVVGNPDSFESHFRWRRPFTDDFNIQSSINGANYLRPVYNLNGARIYALDFQYVAR